MNVKAVIFDMDGLMIDSERIYTQITAKLLLPYGKTMSNEIKINIMGRSSLDAAAYLINAVGISDIVTPVQLIAEMEPMLQEAFANVPALPGVERLVAHLVKHNIPMAIATGSKLSSYHLKTSKLPHIFLPFAGRIMTGDNPILAGKAKPNPRIFLEAAKFLPGVGLNEMLVFEDGKLGVIAAEAAGMRCIWIPEIEMLEIPGIKEGLKYEELLGSMEDFKPELYGLPPY